MRRARAAIRRERGRHLGHAQAGERGLHHHLGGELHAGGAQVELEDAVAAEGAQAAVEVAHRDAEEDAADGGEHRVAEIFVQRRHGAGLDAAGEAVAHDQVVALVELGQEAGQMFEVVAGVGVGHHHVLAAGRLDAGDQRRAVAAGGDVDYARAFDQRDLQRPVDRAVVGDHDFAGKAGVVDGLRGLANADGESLGLIQARHEDGEVEIGHGEMVTKLVVSSQFSVVSSSAQ